MSYPLPSETLRIHEWIVQGGAGGQVVLNRGYGVADTAAATALTSADILDRLRARWVDTICSVLSAQYAVTHFLVKEVASSLFANGRWSFTYSKQDVLYGVTGDVGAIAGDCSPIYVAATVQLKTGNVGRSWKGSKRLSPIVETYTAVNDPNYLGATSKGLIQTAVDAFYATLLLDGVGSFFNHLVASPLLLAGRNGQDDALYPSWAARITQSRVNNRLGSQITRKTRRDYT